jgi:hypothetical protein
LNLATAILLHIFTNPTFVILSFDAVKFEQTINDTNFMLRSALFWVITQRRVVIIYRRLGERIGPIFKGQRVHSSWTSWPLEMGPIRCPETSVNYYHSTMPCTPEERRSHQHCGGSLISQILCYSCRSYSYNH